MIQQIQSDNKGLKLVRGDLDKASGQVGLNKVYRAPVYQTYWECIQGLHK